jgi:hypothetical protein
MLPFGEINTAVAGVETGGVEVLVGVEVKIFVGVGVKVGVWVGVDVEVNVGVGTVTLNPSTTLAIVEACFALRYTSLAEAS